MFFYNVLFAKFKLLVDLFLLSGVRLKDKLGLAYYKKKLSIAIV
jgi:hypothetical protein